MSDLHLRIADFIIHVSSGDPRLTSIPSPGSARFVVDPCPADISVRVAFGDPHEPGAGPPVFDSGGTWRLFRAGAGRLLTFASPLLGSAPYKTALVNREGTEVDIRLNHRCFDAGQPIDPLEYPLDELIVINLLSAGRGLEIHGCGVMEADGTGYLFTGQSGAGKSTLARLWVHEPGATILSDDRVILRRDDGGYWMYGTPWHGEAPLASPARARLSHVFLLQQHVQHELRDVARPAAVARLFAASFPLFHDATALDFSLRFLDSLAREVRCSELGFAPASSLPGFVRGSVLGHRLQS
jgi:hypothetical protein